MASRCFRTGLHTAHTGQRTRKHKYDVCPDALLSQRANPLALYKRSTLLPPRHGLTKHLLFSGTPLFQNRLTDYDFPTERYTQKDHIAP